MSISDEPVKKDIQSSTIPYFVSLFLMRRTFSLLVALFRISPHGFKLLKYDLISNSSEELVVWFLKNHVDSLPYPIFIVN